MLWRSRRSKADGHCRVYDVHGKARESRGATVPSAIAGLTAVTDLCRIVLSAGSNQGRR